MNASSHVDLPAVFGRYVLLRLLSRGGMGEIFLGKVGELQGFEKPIVIKKILPVLSRDEGFVRRFIEEAKIAITLTHANVVAVYEVGQVRGQYFLAMQYVEGRDLRSLMAELRARGRSLPPQLALYIAREVANGLAYAHRRTDEVGRSLGLVHCDISPPNVLVSFEGEVKIIDFGVAKSAMQQLHHEDEALSFGKFGYMAPEQLLQGRAVDRRSDIYSTGVVLYELLTGHRLFNFPADVDLRTVVREVTAARFARPSERNRRLDDDVDRIVMRALRTEPGERFASAEELRDALQQKLYALDPTISSDDLASFVAELYPGASETLRRMLRALSAQDLTAYRAQLQSASGLTVSFAQAGTFTQPGTQPGAGRASAGARRRGEIGGAGTRQLDEGARVAAAGAGGGGSARRRAVLGLGLLAVALSVFLIFAWLPGGGEGSASDLGSATVDGRGRAIDAAAKGDASTIVGISLDGTLLDGGSPADVEPAKRSDQAAPKRRVQRRRPRRRPRRPRVRVKKASRKKAPITAAAVQTKFRRVRAEYRRFERAYGGRLKAEWQRILFAHTYGKADPTKLDGMLRSLRRQMAAVRGR